MSVRVKEVVSLVFKFEHQLAFFVRDKEEEGKRLLRILLNKIESRVTNLRQMPLTKQMKIKLNR